MPDVTETTYDRARIVPFGESALLVDWGGEPDLGVNARVHHLAERLHAARYAAVRALVPGYTSLLVVLDPLASEPEIAAVAGGIRASVGGETPARGRLAPAEASAPGESGRPRTIPTVYGGEFGPDLEEVASMAGLSPEEVVQRHVEAEQRVYMLGFSPGFPYLGDLPPELQVPRLATPRERVPAGSVAIVGRQTGIYPRQTPGGWRILGRTPVLLFDPRRDPPAYLAPGDRVRFSPIAAGDWERYAGAPADW